MATYVKFIVMLSFTATASESFPNELPAAPEGTFSIVVIPDTQHYYGRGTKREPESSDPITNPTFDAWTAWIAANLDRQRVVFVTHVGDVIDKNEREQWTVARRYMDRLHGKIPYGISVGNHDMASKSGDSSLFQEFFPESRFTQFSWYVGAFTGRPGHPDTSGNNANSVQLFEALGLRFVALHIECNAPDDVLAWTDSILTKHSDRRAIITTHMGLGPLEKPKEPQDYLEAPKGRMQWKKCHGNRGNTPQQMWQKCFCKHRNLFMICNGDQSKTQAYHESTTGKHGNTVHELLSDYGVHGLRVMRFVPEKHRIEVQTWDPIENELCESTTIVPQRAQHQFTLEYKMGSGV